MRDIDTVTVQVAITWLETRMALENFLSESPLPGELRERELVDLGRLIDNTLDTIRRPLREQSGD